MSRSQSASTSKIGPSHARKPLLKVQSLSPPGPTNASLFVTNLRLLDFDTLPDWPKITPQALSSKEVQQDAKHRIRCVEWALFRLFELWDPAETREKLQPFFPPLEPLQSLNLRAALFRSLNELKKNGILGRTSVLRKTMLDECEGEKFEEILLVFSAVVIKQEVIKKEKGKKERRNNQAVAKRLAMAASLSEGERKSLLPLAIAHKASLRNCLARKQLQNERFERFVGTLKTKDGEIKHRRIRAKTTLEQPTVLNQADIEKSEDLLREHWLSNPEWINVLLHGDADRSSDELLNQDFDRQVWPQVQSGQQSLESSNVNKSLLEDLEDRVVQQQKRLRMLEELRAANVQDAKSSTSKPLGAKVREKDDSVVPRFDKHEHLQLGRPMQGSPRKLQISRTPSIVPNSMELRSTPAARYRRLLLTMEEELAQASKTASRIASKPSIPRASPKLPESSEDHETTNKGLGITTSTNSILFSEPNTLAGAENPDASTKNSPTDVHLPQTLVSPAKEELSITVPASQTLDSSLPPSSPPLQSGFPPTIPSNYLSLTDRTRESIALVTNSSDDSSLVLPHSPSFPTKLTPEDPPNEPSFDHCTSLLERTRLSIANVAATASPSPTTSIGKAHHSAAGHRRAPAGRLSPAFPVNPFATPPPPLRKGREKDLSDGDIRARDGRAEGLENTEEVDFDGKDETTPKEELFSDEAAYASVFKSRPRVAVSPGLSPTEARRVVSPLNGLQDGDGEV